MKLLNNNIDFSAACVMMMPDVPDVVADVNCDASMGGIVLRVLTKQAVRCPLCM